LKVKCNKCDYIGDESEFPKGRDFLQKEFIKKCANKKCDNFQTEGDASLRMFPNRKHPFEFIREEAKGTSLEKTIHHSKEAS
jgi:hypothetical protein